MVSTLQRTVVPTIIIAVLANTIMLAQTCSAFVVTPLSPITTTSRPFFVVNNHQAITIATTKTTSSSSLSFGQCNMLPSLDNDAVLMHAPEMGNSMMLLAKTEAWVQPVATGLGPILNLMSFFMLCRVVISWYPTTNRNEFPFLLAVWPTEPLLKLIRDSVPPAFGVDISPIVWFGVFTFLNEILVGQQGLLTMKMKYGI